MCLYIGGLISQAGSSAFANGHCAAFGGVKSSVLIDGDHPESMTLAEQDSPPPLSEPGGHHWGRQDEACV